MGSFDCYCAICSGPLGDAANQFGPKTAKAAARRRKQLEKNARRNEGAQVKSDEEGSEFEDDEYDELEEKYSYDPNILEESDVKWLEFCRCIGFNPEASGISKAFVSGRGNYWDYGGFNVGEKGDDPNDPGGDFDCYMDDNPVFPFHETCYELVARCLFGGPNFERMNKDTLYSAMSELNEDEYAGILSEVDYGGLSGKEQFWMCVAGEEWTVCDPGLNPKLRETLQMLISGDSFKVPPTKLALGDRVRSDPLLRLPYDILYLIFPFLDKNSIFSLTEASWHVFTSTRNNTFWNQMIRMEILPWFWELEELLNDGFPDDFDYRGFYFWLDRSTKGSFAMDGPLLGIANRRRIWHVCEHIARVYREKDGRNPTEDEGDNAEEANPILENAISPQMAVVAHPQPKGPKNISSQWIRSWDEMENQPSALETFWNAGDALVGLAFTSNAHRRAFGRTKDDDSSITSKCLLIPTGEWIREIVLFITEVDLYEKAKGTKDSSRAFVADMAIKLTSGGVMDAGPIYSDAVGTTKRALVVGADMHLVGLVGQSDSNGVITRIGILQCLQPTTTSTKPTPINEAQRLLWDNKSADMPQQESPRMTINRPIWSQDTFKMVPRPAHFAPSSGFSDGISSDMIPFHVFLWAANKSELKHLKSLSAYVMVGGSSSMTDRNGKWVTRNIDDVLALRAEYQDKDSRITGNPPQSSSESGTLTPESFVEKNWNTLDIDGRGGECVTEVHVSRDAKAIKLRTNRDQECYWGEVERDQFDVLKAEEGEVLAGLVISFGQLSGFVPSRNYSVDYTNTGERTCHLKMTNVTALTMRVGNGKAD